MLEALKIMRSNQHDLEIWKSFQIFIFLSQLRGTISLVWQPSRARRRWSEQGTGVPPCVAIACHFAIIQAVNLRFHPGGTSSFSSLFRVEGWVGLTRTPVGLETETAQCAVREFATWPGRLVKWQVFHFFIFSFLTSHTALSSFPCDGTTYIKQTLNSSLSPNRIVDLKKMWAGKFF